MTKKLYKSRKTIFIDGVCGGISEYFNIDPTLVRLAWILISFAGGSGIIAYIVCMIVIPREPAVTNPDSYQYDPQNPNQN